jgi:hypothetical protein
MSDYRKTVEKYIPLEYPKQGDNVNHLKINIETVRASDGIRVSYDFGRDGWKIEQPRYTDVLVRDNVYDQVCEWVEMSFLQSWALEDDDDD